MLRKVLSECSRSESSPLRISCCTLTRMISRHVAVSASETVNSETIKVVRMRQCFMDSRSQREPSRLSRLLYEFVSDPMNRPEVYRVRRFGLELLPELEYLIVNGARGEVEAKPPNIVEQFVARDTRPGLSRKNRSSLNSCAVRETRAPAL